MLGMVRAAMSYVQTSRGAGTAGDALRSLQDSQVAHLRLVFARTGCDTTEATSVINEIIGDSSDTFTQAHRAALVLATQQAVTVSDMHTGTGKTQTHLFLWTYLPQFDWDTLKDKSKSEEARMACLVDVCHAIGLKHHSEPTKKIATAIVIVSAGTELAYDTAYALSKRFSFQNAKRRESRTHVAVSMWTFPEDVSQFMVAHGSRYNPEHPPVAPQVDVQLLRDVMPWVASRSNNRLVRDSHTPRPVSKQDTALATVSPDRADVATYVAHCFQMLLPMLAQGMAPPFAETSPDKLKLEVLPKFPALALPAPSPVEAEALDGAAAGCGVERADAKDEVDAMLLVAAEKTKPKKTNPKPVKNRAAATKNTIAKRPAAKTAAPSSSRASADGPFPTEVLGCRVLYSAKQKRYRVFPTKGSVFEKSFPHTSRPRSEAWRDVLAYCAHPTR